MSARFPYSPARVPPVPAVVITLLSPDGSASIPAVSAHLDSAADLTVVPLPLIQRLGLQPLGQVTGRGLGSVGQRLDLYPVSFEIPGVAVLTITAASHPHEPFVLIGRDVLNLFRVTFDGPNQVVEFH
jgi:hypothetical protein